MNVKFHHYCMCLSCISQVGYRSLSKVRPAPASGPQTVPVHPFPAPPPRTAAWRALPRAPPEKISRTWISVAPQRPHPVAPPFSLPLTSPLQTLRYYGLPPYQILPSDNTCDFLYLLKNVPSFPLLPVWQSAGGTTSVNLSGVHSRGFRGQRVQHRAVRHGLGPWYRLCQSQRSEIHTVNTERRWESFFFLLLFCLGFFYIKIVWVHPWNSFIFWPF